MRKDDIIKKPEQYDPVSDPYSIGKIKRFLEVWCADGKFRDAMEEDPYKAASERGF